MVSESGVVTLHRVDLWQGVWGHCTGLVSASSVVTR
jgi:hypothetical protein